VGGGQKMISFGPPNYLRGGGGVAAGGVVGWVGGQKEKNRYN
jgi:hypothetical protein